MARRGPLAKLWDILKGYSALRTLRASTGEAGMARLNPFGTGGGSGPGAWQWERAEQVRHYRHWVYTCVDFLAAKVTETPPQVAYAASPGEQLKHTLATKAFLRGRGEMPDPRKWVSSYTIKNSTGSIRPNEELEYADAGDPLLELLLNPNEPDTWVTFWRQQVIFYKLTGVAYTWMVESEEGPGVAELWTIPSHWVKPVCLGREKVIDYFEVTPYGSAGGSMVRFDPDELIEVKAPNPLNIIGAQSPLQANSEIIDQYESVQAARYWSNKNGANIGAVLQCEDGSVYPTDEEITRLETSFYARFQGETKFARPMVVPPGMRLDRGETARELAFIQSSDQLRDYVVSQTFRLSKTALGITDGVPWATFVGEMRRVIQDVVNPDLALFGGEFTEKLARKFSDRARLFWTPKVPRDDAQQLAEWSATPGPAVSINEYRVQILNLEPLDDPQYDTPMQPAGMVPGGGEDPFGSFDTLGESQSGEPVTAPGDGEAGSGSPADEDPDAPDYFKGWTFKRGRPPFDGAVFDETSHRWVKPAEAGSKPSSGSGSPTAAETPANTGGIKDAAKRTVARLKAVGSKALDTKVGRFIVAAEHKLSIVAHKTREVAIEAAKRRGLDESQTARLTRTLAIADFVGGYVTGAVAATTISPIAGKAAAFLPSVSVLYVAYSTVRDPAATWAAARHVAVQTIHGGGEHKGYTAKGWDADTLADYLAEHVQTGWHEALFLACLAETGDLDKAIGVFEEALQTDPDFPADAPAPTAADFGVEDEGNGDAD